MFKNISSSILIYKCSKSGERITLEPNQTSEFGNDYLIRQKLLSDIGGSVCEKEKVDDSADLRKQVSTLKRQLTKANKKIIELEAKIAEFNDAGNALDALVEEITEEEASNG